MSSESELEVPYALNFSEDDDSSVGFDSPGREEVHREPIRAGDILSYTNPVYTVGNPEGARRAVVLRVDSSRSYPLVLDNAEHLPLDTRVQRIAVASSKGQVSPHPGRCKPIESFQLRDSGDMDLSDVLLERATKLRRNMADLEAKAVHAYVHGVGSASRSRGSASKSRNAAAKKNRSTVPNSSATDETPSTTPMGDTHSESLGEETAGASSPDSAFLEDFHSKQNARRRQRQQQLSSLGDISNTAVHSAQKTSTARRASQNARQSPSLPSGAAMPLRRPPQKKKHGEDSSDSDESSRFLDNFVRRPTSTTSPASSATPSKEDGFSSNTPRAHQQPPATSKNETKTSNAGSGRGGLFSNLFSKSQRSTTANVSNTSSAEKRRTKKLRASAVKSDKRHSTPSKLSAKQKDKKISDFFSSVSSRKKKPKIGNSCDSSAGSTAEQEWSESSISKSRKKDPSSVGRQKRTKVTPSHRPMLQLCYGSPKQEVSGVAVTASATPLLCDSSKKPERARPIPNQRNRRFPPASQSSSSCTNVTSPQASQDAVSPTMSSQRTRTTLGSGGTTDDVSVGRHPASREHQHSIRRTGHTSERLLHNEEEDSYATNPTADTFGSSASTRKDLFQARGRRIQQPVSTTLTKKGTSSHSSGRNATMLSISSEESRPPGALSRRGSEGSIKEQSTTTRSVAVVKESRASSPPTKPPNSNRKRRIHLAESESASESDSSSLSLKAPTARRKSSPSASKNKEKIVSKQESIMSNTAVQASSPTPSESSLDSIC
eukprot:Nitzschia sp. Nitz4//scaffold68_size99682//2698//5022//NITZ4_004550-RA/size99682-processed-gene-0.32-mRNA-1//-1//CDS//3329556551//4303//frame0